MTSPPRPTPETTPEDWQENGWYSFRHVDDILDTARIRNHGPTVALESAANWIRPDGIHLGSNNTTPTVRKIIDETQTDGWMVLHRDEVVFEEYPDLPQAGNPRTGRMWSGTPHLLMSVTKSITGIIAGILEHGDGTAANPPGVLKPALKVTDYAPELGKSGYAHVSVRDVLDMRTPIKYSEDYTDDNSEVKKMEAAAGWVPMPVPTPDPEWERNTKDFLRKLEKEKSSDYPADGKPFAYRSCDAGVAGWICERAYQMANGKFKSFADLVSELLWSKLGVEKDAYISVDANGTGAFDGGICATLRDLARFGAMICRDGESLPITPKGSGQRVVKKEWVDDIFTAKDTEEAFKKKAGVMRMEGGKYRSLFWAPTKDRDVVVCIGVYGQMVYINRKTKMVGVKLSSRPRSVATDDKGGAWGNGYPAFEMFRAIDKHLQDTRP